VISSPAITLLAGPPDCVRAENSLCQVTWNATHNSWLTQSSSWLIARPLRIAMIVLVALLIRWFASRLIDRITAATAEGGVPRILRPLRDRAPHLIAATEGLVSERRRQRAETIGSVLRSIASAVIFVVASMMVLAELSLNLAPLLASAGIVGVAIGFGAQNLVKDFLSGMFMILEDQYGVGDIVDLGEASGVVEAVGLRTTTVRDGSGVVWYLRNGEVLRVGNRSQGWSVVTIDVPLPFTTKVESAQAVLDRVARDFGEDEQWKADLLEPPTVLGVESFSNVGLTVRMTAKTTTDAQWRVGRELRRRVTDALSEAGVPSGLPVTSLPN
jgi:small-conductance mechanosensitive channel